MVHNLFIFTLFVQSLGPPGSQNSSRSRFIQDNVFKILFEEKGITEYLNNQLNALIV